MEENTCPKPECGRPESTHRWSAGKKLSICGNGHSWDQAEVNAQREKAREAETIELRVFDRAATREQIRDYYKDVFGMP